MSLSERYQIRGFKCAREYLGVSALDELLHMRDLKITLRESMELEELQKEIEEQICTVVHPVLHRWDSIIFIEEICPVGAKGLVYRSTDQTWNSPWLTINTRDLAFLKLRPEQEE